ncbi:MAG: AAC(3) family N-acetyltransferase [Archangium sp.]
MIVEQLKNLGIRSDDVVIVHTSFRALKPVEGGVLGLIAALREVAGTVVMPTMSAGDSVFDPKRTPSVDMGIVAETFWRKPGVIRSTHPGGSFAAIGPHAERICAPQPLSPPHGLVSPVGVVYELNGKVLLLGVGHDANTTVHLAESLAQVPYSTSYPTVISEGVTELIAETDHCCRGFAKLDDWLGSRQRRGPVAHGEARLMNSRDVVEVAVEQLRRDPLVFLCESGCDECDAARASAQ